MLISHKAKIVFLASPKTGTRSIYEALRNMYPDCEKHGEHSHIVPLSCKDYFTFIVKRNPYDRAMSTYWSFVKNDWNMWRYHDATFFDMMTATNNAELSLLLKKQSDFYKHNRIDATLDFECLQRDFNQLPFVKTPVRLADLNSTRSGIHGLNKANKSPRPEWWKYLSSMDISLINYTYSDDFTLLGYDRVSV
jgi:hypothetical protein